MYFLYPLDLDLVGRIERDRSIRLTDKSEERHQLVAEEAGTPEEARRRLHRDEGTPHHAV